MRAGRIWICVMLFLFATSCEKTIKLDVLQQPPKLVVNATIENNVIPVVALSTSLNYFGTITPEELSKSFVHNATVSISDGSKTYPLKEYPYTDTSGYTVYFYTVDISTPSAILLGKLNTQYHLDIKTEDGQEYTATTTIPSITKTCDSMWWQPAPNTVDTSLCIMFGKFTDPPGLGNYVRYLTKINSGPYLTALNSAYDDQVTDGQTYSIQFDVGWDKNSTLKPKNADDEHFGYAHRGDTVTLKLCNIDKGTFNFWNTWDYAYQSYGNPFSSPIKITTNISNGALGVFSGYAAQFKTVIIPK